MCEINCVQLILAALVQGEREKCKSFMFKYCQKPDLDIFICLLAHLSQRLIGELIGYPWSGVRPSSSVVNNFKRLLRKR